jgi:hypothetical protein
VVWRIGIADIGEMLAAKFGAIFPHLDERQRRLLMGNASTGPASLDPADHV